MVKPCLSWRWPRDSLPMLPSRERQSISRVENPAGNQDFRAFVPQAQGFNHLLCAGDHPGHWFLPARLLAMAPLLDQPGWDKELLSTVWGWAELSSGLGCGCSSQEALGMCFHLCAVQTAPRNEILPYVKVTTLRLLRHLDLIGLLRDRSPELWPGERQRKSRSHFSCKSPSAEGLSLCKLFRGHGFGKGSSSSAARTDRAPLFLHCP